LKHILASHSQTLLLEAEIIGDYFPILYPVLGNRTHHLDGQNVIQQSCKQHGCGLSVGKNTGLGIHWTFSESAISRVKGKRISCPPHYAPPNNDYDPPHHDYEHGFPLIRSLRASTQRSTSALCSFVLSLLIVAGSFAIRQSKTILARSEIVNGDFPILHRDSRCARSSCFLTRSFSSRTFCKRPSSSGRLASAALV
jgi:hypothetical protein